MAASPYLQKLKTLTKKLHEQDHETKNKNKLLNSFFDMALDILGIIDYGGHLLKINSAWKKTFKIPKDKLEKITFIELIDQTDQSDVLSKMSSIIGSNDSISFEAKCSDIGGNKTLHWTITSDCTNAIFHIIAREI